jgi:hypothetical protein
MKITSGFLDHMQAEVLDISRRGDGRHRVVKVVHNGAPLVLKLYGLKRGRLQTVIRQFFEGLGGAKSSFSVFGRMQTERAVLDLWRREGFAVPKLIYPDFLSRIPQPCLAMEWIPGKTLADVLKSSEVSLSHKQELVEKFVRVMGKRHARALELQDIRLIPEHPTFAHIFVAEDRLVQYDFEIVFTAKRDLVRVVRYELGRLLYSLEKLSKEQFPILVQTLAAAYPDRMLLDRVMDDLLKFGTIPITGWLEKFPFFFRLSKKYRKRADGARSFFKMLEYRRN